jgi:hypothetical protein
MSNAERAVEKVSLAWACRVLAKGDPEGNQARGLEFKKAQDRVWAESSKLLSTGVLQQKARILQVRECSKPSDEALQDLQLDLIFYLVRQCRCPNQDGRRDELRKTEAMSLASKFLRGEAVDEDLEKEVRRWTRYGLDIGELAQLWSAISRSPADFAEALKEGNGDGQDDEKWTSFLRSKLHNLVKDRNRKLTREHKKLDAMNTEELAGDQIFSGPSEAFAQLYDEVWAWFFGSYIAEVIERWDRRGSRIHAFVSYCHRIGRDTDEMSQTQIRKAGRGRDDICEALYRDVVEPVEGDNPIKPEVFRAWVEEVANDFGQTFDAFNSLAGEAEGRSMSREEALRVVACSVMVRDCRIRRPKRPRDTGADQSPSRTE